ncbi:MAG: hypothetical protein A2033_03165 [Bacteroidetes bacterium GWA2_31_9]|nr:MAG: hypothetical protein A2033_03165 [Bacteroidetes bacterium GWA2_31_9]
MKNYLKISINKIVYFSRWSRKKYAILASFGKVVHIAKLSVNIADRSLSKLAKSIKVVSSKFENTYNELLEVFQSDVTENNIIFAKLNPITVNCKNDKIFNRIKCNSRLSN